LIRSFLVGEFAHADFQEIAGAIFNVRSALSLYAEPHRARHVDFKEQRAASATANSRE
jgi:hypothetical protein